MPKNKEALIRYRVINRCIIDYKIVSRQKLITACEAALDKCPISKRTIDGDIHSMRNDLGLGYLAPIKYDRYRQGYYYEDPDYSIDKIPLNNEEIQALTFAATLLEQFKNIEIFSDFSGAVQKIVNAVNLHRLKDEKSTLNFIDFEKVPFFKGSEYLQPIIKAIKEKNVLSITYQKFYSKEQNTHTRHPYLLKEYRNRWYLIGLNDYYKEIRTYGLDRIKSLENSSVKYIDSNFDAKEYFRNTIGLIVPPTKPPKIKLSFIREQGQYVITQPIHESQEIVEENDEKVIINLQVHPTYELKSLILGWGKDVEVLEPVELREEIIKIHKESIGIYKK